METDKIQTARRDVGCEDHAKAAQALQWDRLPIEVKIERVREALLMMSGQVAMAGKLAASANELVHTHEHVVGRGLMKPVTGHGGLAEMNAPGWSDHPTRHLRELLA